MKAVYENHYLSDTDVANFARQSFAKLAENFTEAQNNNLIKFLARGMASGDWETLINKMFGLIDPTLQGPVAKELAVYLRNIPEHFVPFAHPQISLRMQAPVPIARQAFKHKIGFIESEESRRYISSMPELFIPDTFRAKPGGSVKQGSGGEHPHSEYWVQEYRYSCNRAIGTYEQMLKAGVCPEQARFVLPQGCEVNWVWTGSLYAYSNFFNQRSNSHAQKEIQELAKMVGDIIEPLYPVSWGALTRGEY
jgi:thymidylate synthase (FAD)